MGSYLNPGGGLFRACRRSKIYVDKSNLITKTNEVLGTEQRFVCVSRPRRFGKSMAANMLAAYYGRDEFEFRQTERCCDSNVGRR